VFPKAGERDVGYWLGPSPPPRGVALQHKKGSGSVPRSRSVSPRKTLQTLAARTTRPPPYMAPPYKELGRRPRIIS